MAGVNAKSLCADPFLPVAEASMASTLGFLSGTPICAEANVQKRHSNVKSTDTTATHASSGPAQPALLSAHFYLCTRRANAEQCRGVHSKRFRNGIVLPSCPFEGSAQFAAAGRVLN